jgi:hypothetical protein
MTTDSERQRRFRIATLQSLDEVLPSGTATAYSIHMTKLLEKALEAVRRLPPGTQDETLRQC